MKLQKANQQDVAYVADLYDRSCAQLEANTNYPLWKRGVYPSEATAIKSFEAGDLFIFTKDNERVGCVVLNQIGAPAYNEGDWQLQEANPVMIHGLAKDFLHKVSGTELVTCIINWAKTEGYDSIRLDAVTQNTPAIALYEKLGFQRVGKVDLQLDFPWVKWFYLYELVLA